MHNSELNIYIFLFLSFNHSLVGVAVSILFLGML